MAHGIEEMDGMYLTGEKPWHYDETVDHVTMTDDALTSAEVLKIKGIDYTVESMPVFVDGKEVDGYKANSVDGNVLGIVSDRYKILQNRDAFSFIDGLLENDDVPIKYESAGSLFNRKKAWILARMPDRLLLGDTIENYLFFSNGHDGKSAITVGLTGVRVLCANTLQVATSTARRTWTTKHMGDMDAKKHEAARTLQLAVSYLDALNETAELWQQKAMSKEAFNTLTEMLFPMDEDDMDCIQTKRALGFRSNFIDLYNEKPDIQKFHGTAWGAYMALTDFVSHVKPARMTSTYKENLWASFMDGNKVLEQGQKAIELVTA